MPASPIFVRNPTLNIQTNLPSSKGVTRNVTGQLEYLNPLTGTYVPAVRLQDIRQRLLQQSFQDGNGQGYKFPKAHGDINGQHPTDRTSFILQDQDYGEVREHRHPILFQLRPTNNVGWRPTAYVMDNGCVVLDSSDHGIRDFGNDLPQCISSRIEGWDIETYLRRNKGIRHYDIIARMPPAYLVGPQGLQWHQGTPRTGTIGMRSTRFRLKAGCLAWTEKGDSSAKSEKMLSFMPASCITSNSTRGFRNLTREEQAACETAKGKRGNKSRRSKRENAAAQGEGAVNDGLGQHQAEQQSPVVVDDALESQSGVGKNEESDIDAEGESVDTDHSWGVEPRSADQSVSRGSNWSAEVSDDNCSAGGSTGKFGDDEHRSIRPLSPEQDPKVQGREPSPELGSLRKEVLNPAIDRQRIEREHSGVQVGPNELPTWYYQHHNQPSITGPMDNAVADQTFGKSNANDGIDQAWAPNNSRGTPSAAEELNPENLEFATLSYEGIERGDYRFWVPSLPGTEVDAKEHVQRALSLTLVDYLLKVGRLPPIELIENYWDESYASQWLRFQKAFEEHFAGQQAPDLFLLPEWHGGWERWEEVLNEEGIMLWRLTVGRIRREVA